MFTHLEQFHKLRQKCNKDTTEGIDHTPQGWGGGGGGTRGFEVTGMIEGFFGFETFDSGIFLDRNIWQICFWGGLILVGMFLGITDLG